MKIRALVLLIVFAACALPGEMFSVVVKADNPARSISKTQLRKMMLGEMPTWPGGAKVLVLTGPSGDTARTAALKEICGMEEADFYKMMMQAQFNGKTKPAVKSLASTATVRSVVALTAGSIGIVDGTEAAPGLKILPVN